MKSFTGAVALIELNNLHLAVPLSEALMIGQGSEVTLSKVGDKSLGKSVGRFKYADADLPTYFLNDKLLPNEESLVLKDNQFCIGLKTSDEADYFVLLCKQFEQIDVSEQTHKTQGLPAFMCHEKTVIEGLFEHQQKVYLITSPDKLLDYLSRNDTDQKQESENA